MRPLLVLSTAYRAPAERHTCKIYRVPAVCTLVYASLWFVATLATDLLLNG